MTWPQGTGDPYGQQPGGSGQQPGGYDPNAQQYSGQPYSADPYAPYPGYDPYAPQQSGPPQQGYQQQGYQQQGGYQQPYAAPYQPRPTNTMAILSLVFAFVFSPLGIVFGHIAKKQIAERGEDGSGLATAGMVIGYIATGLWLLTCIGYVVIWAIALSAASTASTSYDSYTFILQSLALPR